MFARMTAPFSLPHRKILVATYGSMAVFLVAEILIYWNDALQALSDYVTSGGIAGPAAIAIAYTTPLSCAAIAYLVYRRKRTLWIIAFIAQTVFMFSFAVLPAMYLLWWYWQVEPQHDHE